MRRPSTLTIQLLALLFVPLAIAQISDERPRCLSNVCLNGGICFINKEARSFECSCSTGYTGTLCETRTTAAAESAVPSTASSTPPTTAAEATNEVDVCSAVDCLNGGTCRVKNGAPVCLCRATFWGDRCANVSVDTSTIRPVLVRDPCNGVWCGSGMRCMSRGNLYNCLPVDEVVSTAASVVHVTPQPVLINDHPSTPTTCEQQDACFNGGRCSSTTSEPGFHCECPAQWTGPRCQEDVDECISNNPCLNNGTCMNLAGNFECVCPSGVEGTLCDSNKDDCRNSPCMNGGTCLDEVDDFHCNCPAEWTGKACEKRMDPCSPNPCHHSAPCSTSSLPPDRDYVCSCLPGFTGGDCETNVDDCVGVVCQNAKHVCVDGLQTYECRCAEGYRGDQCDQNINECAENPRLCRQGATCVDSPGNYTCLCQSGFTGRTCDVDIDECAVENACKFGICRNTPGSFECFCRPGFSGADCSQNQDECLSDPCFNDGLCVDSANGFVCLCENGFSGALCQIAPESCNSRPCLNNGVCQKNLVGSTCLCRPGFSGKWCEIEANITTTLSEALISGGIVSNFTENLPSATSSNSTEEYNPCDINPCQYDGTCLAGSAGARHCDCHAGYTGPNCEIDLAECLPSPCANGGECFEKSHPTTFSSGMVKGQFSFADAQGFVCVCQPGYQGETCGEPVRSAPINCASNPCVNGSTCEETNSGYQCVCPVGFVGADCREDVDECLISNTCANAVKCINLVGSFRCVCQSTWGGQRCDTPLTGCEKNNCTAQQLCTPHLNRDGGHAHTCHCPAGKGGAVCASDSTASFNHTSQLAIVSAVPEAGAPYELSLSMRTTLPDAKIVTGMDVLSRVDFELSLQDGVPALQLMGVTDQLRPNLKGEKLNDGEWWTIEMKARNATIVMTILDANGARVAEALWPQPGEWRVFTTKLGGAGQEQESTAFVGCLRNVEINGKHLIPAEHAATSLHVDLGCHRLIQCTNDTCNGHGKCVDLWDHYECDCQRPFLSPQCVDSLVESTFGRENTHSYARIEMSRAEQQQLEMTTDISMLVRTLQANGTIAFVGSRASAESDLDTFIAIELLNGQLRANVKLGGRDVHSFIGGSGLNDGKVHAIRILRHENNITGFVDDKSVFNGEIVRPFPHPLLATLFYVGGMPAATRAKRQEKTFPTVGPLLRAPTFSNGAFSTDTSFKGTIQDLRINGMHVPFWPAPASVDASTLFGRITEQEEVLNGTVSDDTCRSQPCQHGTCKVTFNDYECACEVGWMDKNCSSVDHCAKNVCPLDAKCSNVDEGYLCQGAATFEKYSSVAFDLNLPETAKPIFYTISFKLRTRDRLGVLFYASSNSSDNFLLLELSNGVLNLNYQLGENKATKEANITGSINVTDGQWHAIKLTLLTEQSSVNVDTQQSAIFLSARPTLPISDLFANGSKGQLTVGAPSHDQMQLHASRFASDAVGFKGCLDEVQWGSLPVLSLMTPETYGGSMEKTVHFKPTSARDVTSGVCQSEPQCALPDPVNGPCVNNATCDDLWNARTCRCLPGFNGAFCETNIDDCVGNECSSNGTCVDGIQKYMCACTKGYGGQYCETEINECQSNPCQNAGTCANLIGRFECTCNANYTGDMCEILITVDCDSSPCHNGATCEDRMIGTTKFKSFACKCPPGYTGKTCDKEIDYCDSNPCQNGALCQNRRDTFSHFCACAPGYSGTECQLNIDECESSPCLNGGVCTDGINSFQCNCTQGWTGSDCSTDIDECLSLPCTNNGTCVNLPGSHECKCENYYLGDHCEHPGSCLSSPCSNHAVCEQENATAHRCVCSYEYTGVNCETEIDFCLSSPCEHNGTCDRKLGGFLCRCQPGYSGDTCATDINECESQPCQNSGRCIDAVAAFSCDCAMTGYQGATCGEDINECSDTAQFCLNGRCDNLPGTYKCICDHGFIGSRCNKENLCLPDAKNVTRHQCQHGRCVRPDVRSRGPKGKEYDESVYDCECNTGYEGVFCAEAIELVERAKGPPLTYIIGPVIGVIALLSVLGCLAFMFIARNKRATHGTYSPSRQEMSGARVQMNPMMKPPPEERLI